MAQTHKFRKSKSLFSTTLQTGIGTGTGDTITLGSTTGLPTDTEITLTFDRVDANNVSLGTKVERITGTISGNTLTSYTRGVDGTTEQAHSSNAVVEYIWSGDEWNDAVDGIIVEHNQDGTHKETALDSMITGTEASGDIIYHNGTIWTRLAKSATNQLPLVLQSGLPAWLTGDLNLPTSSNIQVNSADPKRGIYVPANAMFGATTSGAERVQNESSTNKINYISFDFDKDSDEYAWFVLPAPSYWDLSTVTAEFHWTAASGSGTACWGIAGLSRSNDDAIDTALGTVQTTTDTLIATGDNHLTSDTSAITIGGTPAKDDFLYFRVLRDVSEDTLDADAKLIGVTIRFGISQYDDQ